MTWSKQLVSPLTAIIARVGRAFIAILLMLLMVMLVCSLSSTTHSPIPTLSDGHLSLSSGDYYRCGRPDCLPVCQAMGTHKHTSYPSIGPINKAIFINFMYICDDHPRTANPSACQPANGPEETSECWGSKREKKLWQYSGYQNTIQWGAVIVVATAAPAAAVANKKAVRIDPRGSAWSTDERSFALDWTELRVKRAIKCWEKYRTLSHWFAPAGASSHLLTCVRIQKIFTARWRTFYYRYTFLAYRY